MMNEGMKDKPQVVHIQPPATGAMIADCGLAIADF